VGGKLFALQVSIDHTPVVFGSDPVADVFSTAQLKLHTPHATWPAAWVLLHDTAVDGFASFDANALAKQKLATPFKRPENAEFLPGSGFRTFYFCPTGDTDINAGSQPALAARGSWGSIFKAHFPRGSHRGSVSLVVLGDIDHASFDNLAFADDETLLATEDRGDTLHDQADRLEGEVGIDPHGASRGDHRMLGEAADGAKLVNRAAVVRQAGGTVRHRTAAERREHLRAEEGLLLRTELAPAAGRRERDDHVVADLEIAHTRTDFLDDAPRLVTENDRQRSAHDPMDTGVVAVTETAGYDADRDLVRLRPFDVELREPERSPGRLEHGRLRLLHRCFPLGVVSRSFICSSRVRFGIRASCDDGWRSP
jgi:hypothetical protein